MNKEMFYREYANTPMGDRFELLDVNNLGLRSLHSVYQELHELDELMRPYKIRQDELLKHVTNVWIKTGRI